MSRYFIIVAALRRDLTLHLADHVDHGRAPAPSGMLSRKPEHRRRAVTELHRAFDELE
jgi:hypothetical protein